MNLTGSSAKHFKMEGKKVGIDFIGKIGTLGRRTTQKRCAREIEKPRYLWLQVREFTRKFSRVGGYVETLRTST